MAISVQEATFDCGALIAGLHERAQGLGALATFIGHVRDLGMTEGVEGLFLEHYPGMTEKALAGIVETAGQRWPLLGHAVVHRVGELGRGEPIVFVGVATRHRQDAFDACAFIMDQLKTRAPFWKRERTADGEHWVESRHSDALAAQRWERAQA